MCRFQCSRRIRRRPSSRGVPALAPCRLSQKGAGRQQVVDTSRSSDAKAVCDLNSVTAALQEGAVSIACEGADRSIARRSASISHRRLSFSGRSGRVSAQRIRSDGPHRSHGAEGRRPADPEASTGTLPSAQETFCSFAGVLVVRSPTASGHLARRRGPFSFMPLPVRKFCLIRIAPHVTSFLKELIAPAVQSFSFAKNLLPITARISIIARGEAFGLSRQSGKHPATRNQKNRCECKNNGDL